MVRRHLRSWLNDQTGVSEDEMIDLFVAAMTKYPDLSMRQLAVTIDADLRTAIQFFLENPHA